MLDLNLLCVQLDKTGKKAVYIQIADCIVRLIENGTMKPGEPMPGTRQIAAGLGVNRNTVVQSFEILLVEGWLISEERKRTYVSDRMPISSANENGEIRLPATEIYRKDLLFFDDGLPDASCAPMEELARAYRRILSRKARCQVMNLASEFGDEKFRHVISMMLNQTRGLRTSLHEVCITRGSQMALFLTAHCLLRRGDVILVENPGFKPAWEAFEHAGAFIIPVSVDDEGIDVAEVEAILKKREVKAVYLTPHHQYPTTVTLSLARRVKLVELSNQYGFTIVEDDYDNVFHFSQHPVLPISSFESLDKSNYVYIGSLSKLIAPAIRVGYIAASPRFINKVGQLRKIVDAQGDTMMEQSIMELIGDGDIRRHQKRMLAHYERKRDYFASLLEYYLADKVVYKKPDSGLAFWIKPLSDIDLFRLKQQANAQLVSFYTPDRFSFASPVVGLRLGYASLSEVELRNGVEVLSRLL